MEKEVVIKLHSDFEQIVQVEEETKMKFWLARDIQGLLGYAKWDNFVKVIGKAKISCETSGYDVSDHFLDVGKMIVLGKGGKREIKRDDLNSEREITSEHINNNQEVRVLS